MKKFLLAAASLSLVGALYGCKDSEDCSDDFDCPGTDICGADNTCVSNGTNPNDCVLDEDCTGGYSCNLDTSVCNTSCTTDDHCAGGLTCDENGACVGGGNAVYNRVLIVSATPDDKEEGSCRAPNPGADIDYVEILAGGTAVGPTTATGATSTVESVDGQVGVCGSAEQTYWAEPKEVLGRDSIPDVIPGECVLSDNDNETSNYFFLGIGQELAAGGTVDATSGRVLIQFDTAIQDGDTIKIYEVNNADGAEPTCTNEGMAERAGDSYHVILVSSNADVGDNGAGVALAAPDFIYIGEYNGVAEAIVSID